MNDDQPAPSNDLVDNVTFTVVAGGGSFQELPGICLVDGVDPASSISADGLTLTCNTGTQTMGTAVAVQTPVLVTGSNGEQLSLTGDINGVTAAPDDLPIVGADFGLDMTWSSSGNWRGGEVVDSMIDLDYQWTLNLLAGSEVGPDSITVRLVLSNNKGSVSRALVCEPYTVSDNAGHPWSGGDHPGEQLAPFVDSCTLAPGAVPGVYFMTLTGIDYSLAQVPTKDAAGNLLPLDRSAIASGRIVVRTPKPATAPMQVSLAMDAATYTAPSGVTFVDDASNNTTEKTWTGPGAWATSWQRWFTNSGGSNWDYNYRVSPGTLVSYGNNYGGVGGLDPQDVVWQCQALDTQFVTFASADIVRPGEDLEPSGVNATYYYYVGNDPRVTAGAAGYNPQSFARDCAVDPGGWTTTLPTDLSTVKAVRTRTVVSDALAATLSNIILIVQQTIKDDAPAGMDVWSFASFRIGATVPWYTHPDPDPSTIPPDAQALRYPGTSGSRDLVRITVTRPIVDKSVDRAVLAVGDEATYTLEYAAVGEGDVPATVDGFQLIDTLPAGLTYVPGSASPEPVVTGDASAQTLTWTLDGVTTNAKHALTYRAALAPSAQPGQALVNSVYALSSGITTEPEEAQVTTSTDGRTTIGKSADMAFIPNLNGDGVGEGSWTVTLRSYDPLPQSFTDTIDILPYVGDERGTSFTGDYSLTGVTAPDATVYYTTADPVTLIDDPADASNGSAGDIAGNTVGWTTEFTADATAVRVIGGALQPGATQQFVVGVVTNGVIGGDTLVNRAQARAEHTELVMRTSAQIEIANYYSASLKKYVLDSDGEWRDANVVEDYPTFRPGDTIRYRIVVENTGQGTLTGIEVSDDKQPELGSFVIDELAPGASESHEFEIIADASAGSGVVNTACATADTPADSQILPTINCDPAGFEMDGDPTHTKSIISAAPIGDGQWEIVYGLDVSNVSNLTTSYTLDDELHFTDQVDIVSASVTSAPDGVTLAEPAWDGQGNLRVAADVLLLGNDDEGYSAHNYVLTVIADVPLALDPVTGDLPATQCGQPGTDTDTAFNNTSQLTKVNGEVEDDQACATPPSIGIDKTVSAGPTPNGDGTWTVTYDVVATNTGHADGEYEVTDRMTADGDLEVISGAIVTAPEGVTTSDSWTGLGAEGADENIIATGVILPAGGTHTYQVEVVIGLAAGSEGAPVITECSALEGGAGGLSNAAAIEHNDLTDDDRACVAVGVVTVDKTVSEGPTPNGDGTWTVVYDIVATHVGAAAADYDVTDRLHFGGDVELVSADVITTPEGVAALDSWTGLGAEDSDTENLIAEGVRLEVGESHTYQVETVVELDEDTIDPSALVCAPAGSGENGGLGNSTTLTSNGIPSKDDVCPTLPVIEIVKDLVEGSPTPNGDGTWTVAYDLVVTNSGQAAGDYDLSDDLQYGEDIVIGAVDVISAPEGVVTNADWTGQGAEGSAENVIVTGITLDAGASHTYRVQTVVSLDQEVVTPDALQCPAPAEDGGLANTATLTHNGEERDDAACGELPLIEITKSLSGAVVPVDGEAGVYDATYELTVTNSGPAAGVYDLDDALAPGEGIEIRGIQGVTTDAPDAVGVNEGFNGLDDIRIVSGQPIAGADSAAVTHTYLVTVRYAADLAGVTIPVVGSCTTEDGSTVPGGLNNVATVGWNGLEGTDDECIPPNKPTLDKALVSANPIGDGQWEVVYDLTVGNVGPEPTGYDLDDEFLFAPVIAVDSVSVTGPEGVEIDSAFDGDANQRIATDVTIAGLDDDGYAPHVYRVTVIADVPLYFAPGDIGADGTGSPACTAPAGSNSIEQGLNNAATLTDDAGGTQTDTDCAPLPSIDITKRIVGDPVKGANGAWTVTYEITAINDGAAQGDYTLTDRLRFGAGLEVTASQVTSAPEGVTVADGWTGQGAEGDASNVIASGVALAAGGAHTYQVRVIATVDENADNPSTYTCPEPGSGEPGGFANTAGIDHNDLGDSADACDTPDKPETPDLAVTGATIAWSIIGLAMLLLMLGIIALFIARRRTAVAE
ncbi:DUF7507 domain-containing protein [Microbacterium sp. A588]